MQAVIMQVVIRDIICLSLPPFQKILWCLLLSTSVIFLMIHVICEILIITSHLHNFIPRHVKVCRVVNIFCICP